MDANRERMAELFGMYKDSPWEAIFIHAQRVHHNRVKIELPSDDKREAVIWFSEVKDGVLNLSITVRDPVKPVTVLPAESQVAAFLERGNKHLAKKVAGMVRNPHRRAELLEKIESYRPPVPTPEPIVLPTTKGILKYPPNGYYDDDPCTCTDQCTDDECNCTCRACRNLDLDAKYCDCCD